MPELRTLEQVVGSIYGRNDGSGDGEGKRHSNPPPCCGGVGSPAAVAAERLQCGGGAGSVAVAAVWQQRVGKQRGGGVGSAVVVAAEGWQHGGGSPVAAAWRWWQCGGSAAVGSVAAVSAAQWQRRW